MAKAPKPGSAGTTKGKERSAAARETVRLTIGGEARTLRPGMLTLNERLVVRKATGLPVEQFLTGSLFGLDSLQVIWWLAARQAGNTFLTLAKVVEDWPDDLDPDDVALSRGTDDDEDDEDEDGTDPS